MKVWILITVWINGQGLIDSEIWLYYDEMKCLEQRANNEVAINHLVEVTCIPEFVNTSYQKDIRK